MASAEAVPGAGADPLAAVAARPGVGDAVRAARKAVDALRAHRVLRRRRSEVSAESALRGARASARLDGADIDLSDIEAADGLGQGALRVSAEIGDLTGVWRAAPLQALARLHAVACLGLVDDDRLGRPRPDQRADDPLGLGEPPPPAAVGVRLAALASLLLTPTSAPALVVAAVTHAELLALRPFAAGNGLVARAAQRLVLVDRGLDPHAVSVPEDGHLELADAYAEVLRDYASGRPGGVEAWVQHCAQAVILGARESTAICEALERG